MTGEAGVVQTDVKDVGSLVMQGTCPCVGEMPNKMYSCVVSETNR